MNCKRNRASQSPLVNDFVAPEAKRAPKKFHVMAAKTSRWAASVVAAVVLLAAAASSAEARGDGNGVYEPCADATVQRGDGFTFGVAFSSRDSFFSGDVQLSPCDSRLNLQSRAPLALFRPMVDEISLLTINASGGTAFDPVILRPTPLPNLTPPETSRISRLIGTLV